MFEKYLIYFVMFFFYTIIEYIFHFFYFAILYISHSFINHFLIIKFNIYNILFFFFLSKPTSHFSKIRVWLYYFCNFCHSVVIGVYCIEISGNNFEPTKN